MKHLKAHFRVPLFVPCCVCAVHLVAFCLRTPLSFTLPSNLRPDGDSPKTSTPSKWPLKPGVLVHINAMRNMNSVGQLSPTPLIQRSPKIEESLRRRTDSRYDKGKSKVYARLERLRDMLGFGGTDDGMPVGIYHSPGGGKWPFLL